MEIEMRVSSEAVFSRLTIVKPVSVSGAYSEDSQSLGAICIDFRCSAPTFYAIAPTAIHHNIQPNRLILACALCCICRDLAHVKRPCVSSRLVLPVAPLNRPYYILRRTDTSLRFVA